MHFLFPTVFFSFQLNKCICIEFDDVEMKCSCIEQDGCQLKQLLLSLLCLFFFFFILSTNLMLNRDKTNKKRCELSVFLLYLFIHVHYLFSMRMHLFKSISMHTHKVTNMIIRRAHSMCQNYHIYFVGVGSFYIEISLILFNTSIHLLI